MTRIPKSQALAQVEKLERVLSGALRAGDRQADELVRLSRLNARQRSVMWRTLSLIRRGRHGDAIVVLKTELDPESAQ